jgi:hypothetical protein
MAVSDGRGPSMGLLTIAGGGGGGDGCGEARPCSLSLSLQSTPSSSPPGPDLALSAAARAWWRMRRWWRRHRFGQRGPGSGGRGPKSLLPVAVASSSLFLSLPISLPSSLFLSTISTMERKVQRQSSLPLSDRTTIPPSSLPWPMAHPSPP